MKSLTIKDKGTLSYASREALNRLRINFDFCGDQYKKVMITSSSPDEGKSFISFHLWRVLAESGRRVVLVDADLRRSVMRIQHQLSAGADTKKALGLAHYLAGNATLEDVLYESDIENGFMVPTFRTVANPVLLLQNPRFGEMMEKLGEQFDIILVDTPPLNSVADGLQVARHCDGALLVVRGGVTPRRIISTSMAQLKSIDCPLLGTVLNRVEMDKNPYYYKYSKYSYYNYYAPSREKQ